MSPNPNLYKLLSTKTTSIVFYQTSIIGKLNQIKANKWLLMFILLFYKRKWENSPKIKG